MWLREDKKAQMNENGVIYVVTHKKVDLTKLELDKCYRLIRVGKYSEEESVLLSDRTGENISDKNSNYCELTALYWIWKNERIANWVGLCHYRRYFTMSKLVTDKSSILSQEQVQKLLSKYDVVVPQKEYSYRGAYQAYLDCGREKDIETTADVIQKLYPEYMDSFQKEFIESAGGYPANMIICRKDVLNQYCKWLFSILFEVEKNTNIKGYTEQEARIYGYLSERLLGVWLAKQNLKVKQLKIINTEKKENRFHELAKAIGLEQLVKKIIFQTRIVRC